MTPSPIAVVMGSTSDWPAMEPAVQILKDFGFEVKPEVVSAHRTPEKMRRFAHLAEKEGLKIIIAGAGGSAHLPGMIAAQTVLPVIAVPIKSKALNGFDSLLSIVQMPPGVPVACMAIDGAKNAALYALRILAISNSEIRDKVVEFVQKQTDETETKTIPATAGL